MLTTLSPPVSPIPFHLNPTGREMKGVWGRMPTISLLLDNAAICWQKLEFYYTIMLLFRLINHNDTMLNTHKFSLNCIQDSPSVSKLEGYNPCPMSSLGTIFNKSIKRVKLEAEIGKRRLLNMATLGRRGI